MIAKRTPDVLTLSKTFYGFSVSCNLFSKAETRQFGSAGTKGLKAWNIYSKSRILSGEKMRAESGEECAKTPLYRSAGGQLNVTAKKNLCNHNFMPLARVDQNLEKIFYKYFVSLQKQIRRLIWRSRLRKISNTVRSCYRENIFFTKSTKFVLKTSGL